MSTPLRRSARKDAIMASRSIEMSPHTGALSGSPPAVEAPQPTQTRPPSPPSTPTSKERKRKNAEEKAPTRKKNAQQRSKTTRNHDFSDTDDDSDIIVEDSKKKSKSTSLSQVLQSLLEKLSSAPAQAPSLWPTSSEPATQTYCAHEGCTVAATEQSSIKYCSNHGGLLQPRQTQSNSNATAPSVLGNHNNITTIHNNNHTPNTPSSGELQRLYDMLSPAVRDTSAACLNEFLKDSFLADAKKGMFRPLWMFLRPDNSAIQERLQRELDQRDHFANAGLSTSNTPSDETTRTVAALGSAISSAISHNTNPVSAKKAEFSHFQDVVTAWMGGLIPAVCDNNVERFADYIRFLYDCTVELNQGKFHWATMLSFMEARRAAVLPANASESARAAHKLTTRDDGKLDQMALHKAAMEWANHTTAVAQRLRINDTVARQFRQSLGLPHATSESKNARPCGQSTHPLPRDKPVIDKDSFALSIKLHACRNFLRDGQCPRFKSDGSCRYRHLSVSELHDANRAEDRRGDTPGVKVKVATKDT